MVAVISLFIFSAIFAAQPGLASYDDSCEWVISQPGGCSYFIDDSSPGFIKCCHTCKWVGDHCRHSSPRDKSGSCGFCAWDSGHVSALSVSQRQECCPDAPPPSSFSKSFMDASPPPQPSGTPNPQPAADSLLERVLYLQQAGGYPDVRVRTKEGKFILKLPKGEAVTVLRVDGDRAEVQWSGVHAGEFKEDVRGWVAKGNLVLQLAPSEGASGAVGVEKSGPSAASAPNPSAFNHEHPRHLEAQVEALCGLHSLNHLLQEKRFFWDHWHPRWNEIEHIVTTKVIGAREMLRDAHNHAGAVPVSDKDVEDQIPPNYFGEVFGDSRGNFDIQVMHDIAQLEGITLTLIEKRSGQHRFVADYQKYEDMCHASGRPGNHLGWLVYGGDPSHGGHYMAVLRDAGGELGKGQMGETFS